MLSDEISYRPHLIDSSLLSSGSHLPAFLPGRGGGEELAVGMLVYWDTWGRHILKVNSTVCQVVGSPWGGAFVSFSSHITKSIQSCPFEQREKKKKTWKASVLLGSLDHACIINIYKIIYLCKAIICIASYSAWILLVCQTYTIVTSLE